MSLTETTPTDTVANGNAITPSEHNALKEKEMAVDSTPDLIHKPNIPVLLVQDKNVEEEEEEEEDGVRMKPLRGHTRGSSVSSSGVGSHGQCETNTTTTTNSSSSSLSNSFYSHDGRMGETISLPAGLSHITSSGGLTASDPVLTLAASLKGKTDKEKEETLSRLVEEVVSLKMEMMKLKEENHQLKKSRTDMDDELHTLTENLFGEAYKMVDEAKGERVTAEKRLANATGQIEAMETQVSTLHNLLKTPSKGSPSQKHKKPSVKKMIKKLSRKHISGSKLKEATVTEHKGNKILKEGELPTVDFSDFNKWFELGLPSTPGSHAYFDTILSSHILPCLQFTNEELSKKVHEAIRENTCVLEPLVQLACPEGTLAIIENCELSGEARCAFQLRLNEVDIWHHISSSCRERIVSVCEFYTFLGYVQKGILKKDVTEVYWRIAKYRAIMNISYLSLSLPDSLL